MCGIVGISAEDNVAGDIYDALLMLQHRGQDSAGMVVCDVEGKLNSRKSTGYGISLAHNGNLTNSESLANELFHAEMRHLNTDSDSEVLLNIFAHELGKQREIFPKAQHIFQAVTKTHRRCDGAYAVIALLTGFGLLGFRDTNGIRPLVIGIRKGKNRDEYMIASENADFASLGFETLEDACQ